MQPHHKNFSKRLIKRPKLYFYDTGLACNLLKIASVDQLDLHYLKGNLFENFVLNELANNSASESYLIYNGNENDMLAKGNLISWNSLNKIPLQ